MVPYLCPKKGQFSHKKSQFTSDVSTIFLRPNWYYIGGNPLLFHNVFVTQIRFIGMIS